MPPPRCPDCNKFASYAGEEDIDIETEEFKYDPETGFITFEIEVRRPLNCMECSTELKEARFSFEQEMLPPIDTGLDPDELELTVEAMAADLYEGKKPIFGASITATLKKDGVELLQYEAEDAMPASQFDEMF